MPSREVRSVNFTEADFELLDQIDDLQRLEGWTFSRLCIEALKEFYNHHFKGNPQKRLVNNPTVIKDLRSKSVTKQNPMLQQRAYMINSLEATLDKNPDASRTDVVKAFAKHTGLKLETVREYMIILGR